MKILHVNLAKGFRGGERQTLILITQLSNDPGIEQFLLVRHGSPLTEKVAKLPNVSVFEAKKPFLFSILKTHKVDLVHAHEAQAVKWAYFFQLIKKVPYVLTRRIIKSPSHNFLTKNAYLRANTIIALSQAVKQVMSDYGMGTDIPVIPDAYASLPVQQEKITTLKARWHGKIVVGHVGALVDSDKGQSTVIEAAREAQKRKLNMHFVFVGDGKDKALLLEQSQGLQNIEFCGFQSDVGSYLNAFSYFVFPSLREGLGSSILDAMHAKVPVIASNIGGIPDLVHSGETGILIPPKDSEAILESLLTLQTDEALRKKLVDNAKNRLKRFSPEMIASQYRKIYLKTL